jgi:hypothetical protein
MAKYIDTSIMDVEGETRTWEVLRVRIQKLGRTGTRMMGENFVLWRRRRKRMVFRWNIGATHLGALCKSGPDTNNLKCLY